jgi:DNA-binding SARP family transcriptional activator
VTGQEAGAPEAAPAGGGIRFALFGGVRVIRDGVEIEVTQPKQRAILALLLAVPREPVPLSELVDTLWPGEPSASVINQIHRHVGALRRICEPALPRRATGRYLLPAGGGYRLVVDAGDCDVLQFRGLVREAARLAGAGDRRTALKAYHRALDVAAAPAGDDRLRGLPAFVGLEDERLAAIGGAADLARAPDEVDAVLPALRAVAKRHPLDEALQARLMTALTLAGRSAEALAVYATTRSALRDELGGVPGTRLEDAQAQALRGDEAAPAPVHHPTVGERRPAVSPAQLPSPAVGFAGRRLELAALRGNDGRADTAAPGAVAGLAGRDHAQPRILLVTGMAGVGKTSLALHHAHEVAADYPDGQLYLNLRGFEATTEPTDPRDALRDLLESLGVYAQGLPESLDARSGLLRSVLTERRVLIVLDNARDYAQVEPLLPGSGESRVIVTSRNRIPGLSAFRHARTIALDPFDGQEVLEFLGGRLAAGRDDAGDAMLRLGRACGGLPLALAIVAVRAQLNPAYSLDLLVREFTQEPLGSLDAGSAELNLGTVFSWSLRGLTEDAARAFALISVHPGPEISTAAAVSLSGLSPRRTKEVLTELTTANMIREVRPGRFVLHDLVREYAVGLLGDGRSTAVERLVQHYVRSTRQAVLTFGRPPVTLLEPAPAGIAPETFSSGQDATFWYTEERSVLRQVCHLAVARGDHRSALMLLLDWRPMSQSVNSLSDQRPFVELCADLVDRVDEPALRAEAYREIASDRARSGDADAARIWFTRSSETFAQIGDSAGEANVLRNMALNLALEPGERVELLQRSVALARGIDDQPILAHSLHALCQGLRWAGRFDEAMVVADECLGICAENPRLHHLRAATVSERALALAAAGHLAESATEGKVALDLFREAGQTTFEVELLLSQGDVLTALGRTTEAEATWRRFLTVATPGLVEDTVPFGVVDGAQIIDEVKRKLDRLRGG